MAAIKQYVEEHKLKGRTFVAITTGANMNFDRLRFVAERAEVGEEREALFAVTIPEERGSFKRFCELVGTRNVTEFNYRIADSNEAHVFVGVEVRVREDTERIVRNLRRHGLKTLDLSDNEMAKTHVRHMVGGRAPFARNELLYRFEFPERPGALMRFLDSMSAGWNISLFHYRNHGADYGRVLVGMQVPSGDKAEFRRVDGVIATHTGITVCSENRAEIRRVTLTNHDSQPHDLDLTSHAEGVPAPKLAPCLACP